MDISAVHCLGIWTMGIDLCRKPDKRTWFIRKKVAGVHWHVSRILRLVSNQPPSMMKWKACKCFCRVDKHKV